MVHRFLLPSRRRRLPHEHPPGPQSSARRVTRGESQRTHTVKLLQMVTRFPETRRSTAPPAAPRRTRPWWVQYECWTVLTTGCHGVEGAVPRRMAWPALCGSLMATRTDTASSNASAWRRSASHTEWCTNTRARFWVWRPARSVSRNNDAPATRAQRGSAAPTPTTAASPRDAPARNARRCGCTSGLNATAAHLHTADTRGANSRTGREPSTTSPCDRLPAAVRCCAAASRRRPVVQGGACVREHPLLHQGGLCRGTTTPVHRTIRHGLDPRGAATGAADQKKQTTPYVRRPSCRTSWDGATAPETWVQAHAQTRATAGALPVLSLLPYLNRSDVVLPPFGAIVPVSPCNTNDEIPL